jgi:hypothetical protein
MNRDDIIRMAREAGMEIWKSGHRYMDDFDIYQFAALVAAAERNKLAQWMIQHSYATGHGDTIEDLLKELEWQINERINAWEHSLAEAIRARGQV